MLVYRRWTISLSVKGDDNARLVHGHFPMLTRQQSKITLRLTPERRWSTFSGEITGADYDDMMHVVYSLHENVGVFSMAPITEKGK